MRMLDNRFGLLGGSYPRTVEASASLSISDTGSIEGTVAAGPFTVTDRAQAFSIAYAEDIQSRPLSGALLESEGTLWLERPTLTEATGILTMTDGVVLYTGTGGMSRQWYRDGIAISGETGQSYTLSPADSGATLTAGITVQGVEVISEGYIRGSSDLLFSGNRLAGYLNAYDGPNGFDFAAEAIGLANPNRRVVAWFPATGVSVNGERQFDPDYFGMAVTIGGVPATRLSWGDSNTKADASNYDRTCYAAFVADVPSGTEAVVNFDITQNQASVNAVDCFLFHTTLPGTIEYLDGFGPHAMNQGDVFVPVAQRWGGPGNQIILSPGGDPDQFYFSSADRFQLVNRMQVSDGSPLALSFTSNGDNIWTRPGVIVVRAT